MGAAEVQPSDDRGLTGAWQWRWRAVDRINRSFGVEPTGRGSGPDPALVGEGGGGGCLGAWARGMASCLESGL